MSLTALHPSAGTAGIASLDPELRTLPVSDCHIRFLQKCLDHKDYDRALVLLSISPWEFIGRKNRTGDPAASTKSPVDAAKSMLQIQRFFYLAAQIYIDTGKLEKAYEFLQYILATPSTGCTSTYMLNAFRRWVLLTCIIFQQTPKIPPFGLTLKCLDTVRACSQEYLCLARRFVTKDRQRFMKTIAEGRNLWNEHGNSQLIRMLETAYHTRRLHELNETYSAIPLSEAAQKLGMTTEELLLQVSSRPGIITTDPDEETGAPILRMAVENLPALKLPSEITIDEYIQSTINELARLKDEVLVVQKQFGVAPARIVFKPTGPSRNPTSIEEPICGPYVEKEKVLSAREPVFDVGEETKKPKTQPVSTPPGHGFFRIEDRSTRADED